MVDLYKGFSESKKQFGLLISVTSSLKAWDLSVHDLPTLFSLHFCVRRAAHVTVTHTQFSPF